MEPILLGAGFTQSSTAFTISKADLASYGLVASATNKQEELLAALILHLKAIATQDQWNINANANVFIAEEQPTLTSRTIGTNTSSFYTHQYQVSFTTNMPLNPSNM
jgi:hypothetical protein